MSSYWIISRVSAFGREFDVVGCAENADPLYGRESGWGLAHNQPFCSYKDATEHLIYHFNIEW